MCRIRKCVMLKAALLHKPLTLLPCTHHRFTYSDKNGMIYLKDTSRCLSVCVALFQSFSLFRLEIPYSLIFAHSSCILLSFCSWTPRPPLQLSSGPLQVSLGRAVIADPPLQKALGLCNEVSPGLNCRPPRVQLSRGPQQLNLGQAYLQTPGLQLRVRWTWSPG